MGFSLSHVRIINKVFHSLWKSVLKTQGKSLEKYRKDKRIQVKFGVEKRFIRLLKGNFIL